MSKYLPMCCNDADMREAAAKICRDFLHGAWKTTQPQDLIFRRISGGLSNFLYYVALPDKSGTTRGFSGEPEVARSTIGTIVRQSLARQASFNLEEPKQVLIRIYGQSERGVDNIIMDSVIFTLLSERRLGPKLHGVFSGGRIEEFIPARQLLTKELSEPAFSMKIAEKMAAIHNMDVPFCKEPQWLWKKQSKWLASALLNLENHEPRNHREEDSINKLRACNLEKEVSWLKDYLSSVDSPVVFCHNDLQEGNILLREEIIPQNDETNDDLNVDYSAINHESSSDSFLDANKETPVADPPHNSGEMFRAITTVDPQHHRSTSESFSDSLDSQSVDNGMATEALKEDSHPDGRKSTKSTFANNEDEDCNTSDSLCSHASDGSLGNGEPKLVLIDYEYCSYNHRGFDLANHFVEWAYDYTNPDYPFYFERFENYPTLEQKEIFMRQYLIRYSGREATTEEVNQLNSEVDAFTLASHLFWCLWAVFNAPKSQIPFGYWDYAVSRLDWYLRLKRELIKDNGGPTLKRKIREVDI